MASNPRATAAQAQAQLRRFQSGMAAAAADWDSSMDWGESVVEHAAANVRQSADAWYQIGGAFEDWGKIMRAGSPDW